MNEGPYREKGKVSPEPKEELLFRNPWWRPWSPKKTSQHYNKLKKEVKIYSFRYTRRWHIAHQNYIYYTVGGTWVFVSHKDRISWTDGKEDKILSDLRPHIAQANNLEKYKISSDILYNFGKLNKRISNRISKLEQDSYEPIHINLD